MAQASADSITINERFHVGRPLVTKAVRRNGMLVTRPQATSKTAYFHAEISRACYRDMQVSLFLGIQLPVQCCNERMRIICQVTDTSVGLTLSSFYLGAVDSDMKDQSPTPLPPLPPDEDAIGKLAWATTAQRENP